jgi:hypothetical protein
VEFRLILIFKFKKVKFFPVHEMKAYRGSRNIAPLITSALDGGEYLTSRPWPLYLGRKNRYPINRRLVGPQSRSGDIWGEYRRLTECQSVAFLS